MFQIEALRSVLQYTFQDLHILQRMRLKHSNATPPDCNRQQTG